MTSEASTLRWETTEAHAAAHGTRAQAEQLEP
jgi:hypothetical protein